MGVNAICLRLKAMGRLCTATGRLPRGTCESRKKAVDRLVIRPDAERNRVSASPCLPCWIEESEARPRDFSARFDRKPAGWTTARRPARARRTIGLVAIAAVALPAFAQPAQWDRFEIGDAVAQDTALEPMPFETAGKNFPGSAFYYLQADPVRIGQGIHSDAQDSPARTLDSGPAARSMLIFGGDAGRSETDRSRALQCLTTAIYYEAGNEPEAGQRAVAQVVLNRVAHPAYPATVCGVVFEGSERSTGCQFSFTCDGSMRRKPVQAYWDRARRVAMAALSGEVYAPAGLATHYHTVFVSPYWAPSLHYLRTVGAHRFYRLQGAAGAPGSFDFAYLGGEPQARPNRHVISAPTVDEVAATDPLAVQRAFDARAMTRQPGAAQAPLPGSRSPLARTEHAFPGSERPGAQAPQALPEAYGIRPEYANTGRWIAQPGT